LGQKQQDSAALGKLDRQDARTLPERCRRFGWQTCKSARVITLLGAGVNNGSFDGQSDRLDGETGYALHPAFASQTRVTPYLGLARHTGAFTENGNRALNVQAMEPN
jgi:uncharacterized protein with beta-barrel porin domain